MPASAMRNGILLGSIRVVDMCSIVPRFPTGSGNRSYNNSTQWRFRIRPFEMPSVWAASRHHLTVAAWARIHSTGSA
jgi:hypothetical protein